MGDVPKQKGISTMTLEQHVEDWVLKNSGHDYYAIRTLYNSRTLHQLALAFTEDRLTPYLMDAAEITTQDVADALEHIARCYEVDDLL
jgi:hypothetical protein